MFKRYRTLLALCVAPVVIAGCTNDYNFTAPPHTFDVNPQYKAIGLGETLQLTALGADGKPVAATWTSDNPAVASVSATGLVTGRTAGGPIGVIAALNSDPSQHQTSSITVLKGFSRAISGAVNAVGRYTIDVPAGAKTLRVTIAGGTGDVDLYVRFGAPAAGSRPPDNCASEAGGNGETCTITNPAAGTWHIMTFAYEAFTGATLTAIYEN